MKEMQEFVTCSFARRVKFEAVTIIVRKHFIDTVKKYLLISRDYYMNKTLWVTIKFTQI